MLALVSVVSDGGWRVTGLKGKEGRFLGFYRSLGAVKDLVGSVSYQEYKPGLGLLFLSSGSFRCCVLSQGQGFLVGMLVDVCVSVGGPMAVVVACRHCSR